jgi:hypothetical protein
VLSIRNSLGRVSAVGVIAMAAAAGFVAPASAAQVTGVSARLAAVSPAATGPNTTISGSPAKWSPTKLTGPPVTGTCSATNYTFSITNKEKVSETIQYKAGTTKKKLGVVAASTKVAICGSGAKGSKATFYIKGSKSVLTVTLS